MELCAGLEGDHCGDVGLYAGNAGAADHSKLSIYKRLHQRSLQYEGDAGEKAGEVSAKRSRCQNRLFLTQKCGHSQHLGDAGDEDVGAYCRDAGDMCTAQH